MTHITLAELSKKLKRYIWPASALTALSFCFVVRGVLAMVDGKFGLGLLIFLPGTLVFAFGINCLRALCKQLRIVRHKMSEGYRYVDSESETGAELLDKVADESHHDKAPAKVSANAPVKVTLTKVDDKTGNDDLKF